MPDIGTVVTFVVLPLLSILASVAGLKLASRLGVNPVQAQYVALLRGMNTAATERIAQLETENKGLKSKVATLERRERELRADIRDLRQELHEMRDLYAAARKADPE